MSFQPPPPYPRSGGFGPPGAPGAPGGAYGGPPPSYGGNQAHYNSAPGPYGGPGPRGAGAGPGSSDDKLSKVKDPLLHAVKWFKQRSQKEKTVLGAVAGLVVSPGRANQPRARAGRARAGAQGRPGARTDPSRARIRPPGAAGAVAHDRGP
jgi:hypothetical protein